MIGVGVHIYYMFVGKKILIVLNDRLTFSNLRGRTSRRFYRLALPLLTPETLSSLSKSRIVLYNVHLAPFVRMDETNTRTNTSSFSEIGTSKWNY